MKLEGEQFSRISVDRGVDTNLRRMYTPIDTSGGFPPIEREREETSRLQEVRFWYSSRKE